MKSLFTLLMLMFCISGVAAAQTADLFISEYVEGSGYNKALEIYNGTSDPIDLGGYSIEIYNNGATTPSTIALPAMSLVPGDVFVLAHASADPALLALADQTDSGVNFNGDDAVVLAHSLQIVDSIGQVGFDPGSAWTCSLGSTVNATLRRIASFCTGDTTVDDPYDPCESFEFYPSDSFDGLGVHTADCTSVGNGAMSWGSLKAAYR